MSASKQQEHITCQKLTWLEVRQEVKKVNPELWEIIEQLNPDKKFVLYKAKYPYGVRIINNGKFNLITKEGELISFTNSQVSQQLKEQLGYRSIPLSLVLHNACEIYTETDGRIVPLRLLKPGELFGVFEALEPPGQEASAAITNVSAGARSVFMLAKISDQLSHKKLIKEFGLHTPLPKRLVDHGLIFAEISNHQKFSGYWYNEILFFSNEWLKESKTNIGWVNFINYLQKISWEQSSYWRTLTTFKLWKILLKAIHDKNMRPRPYLVDTIKHLIFMIFGAVPGFAPTGDSELTLPVKIIQDVYLKSYQLKLHSPIIMAPCHFSLKSPDVSVYYSLSYPTLLEYSLTIKQAPTIIEDMRDIKLLMQLLESKLREQNDLIYETLKKVNDSYFTCEQDIQGKITSSSELPLLDKKFHSKSRTFPFASTFLRGCIRISSK